MIKTAIKKVISKNTPRWIVLLIDLYIVSNTFLIAYLIRYNFSFDFDTTNIDFQLALVIVASLIGFVLSGSYRGIIRHTGVRDSINVFIACVITLVVLIGVNLLGGIFDSIQIFIISKAIIVIHFLLNILVLIASRFIFKELYSLVISDLKIDKRVLIYGAGEKGLLTYAVLRDDKFNKTFVVGFIDDDKRISKKYLNGLKVYHSSLLCKEFILEKEIDEIIISIEKVDTAKLLEIVDKLSKIGVGVKIVPPAKDWINNDLKTQQIKSVKIEDLLGREPIELYNPIIKKEYDRKIVMVTGAAGSIGSEIARQLSNLNYTHLVLIDQAESDLYNLQQYFIGKDLKKITSIVANIRNRSRMEAIFNEYKPSMVFHAAAYKHVPFMEENPYEAVSVNVEGSQNIADLSLKYHVEKFVMISTDKAVNPTNIMGATKRIAEMYVSCMNNESNGKTKFIITRFGNVLGSNGSVIPLFEAQIKKGGPISVTHKDITRFFMTIPEACQLVLEAGAMGNGGEIFVFDMGKSIKIFDLAKNMIHLSGLKYPDDITIKITGLRPGEKIYEELLASGENTTPTYHEKIMIAKVKDIETSTIKDQIDVLCALNNDLDVELTVAKMKEIVPEFISNNSSFERLDEIKNVTNVN